MWAAQARSGSLWGWPHLSVPPWGARPEGGGWKGLQRPVSCPWIALHTGRGGAQRCGEAPPYAVSTVRAAQEPMLSFQFRLQQWKLTTQAPYCHLPSGCREPLLIPDAGFFSQPDATRSHMTARPITSQTFMLPSEILLITV